MSNQRKIPANAEVAALLESSVALCPCGRRLAYNNRNGKCKHCWRGPSKCRMCGKPGKKTVCAACQKKAWRSVREPRQRGKDHGVTPPHIERQIEVYAARYEAGLHYSRG